MAAACYQRKTAPHAEFGPSLPGEKGVSRNRRQQMWKPLESITSTTLHTSTLRLEEGAEAF